MTIVEEDHLPYFLANKLASYQRGPREARLLRDPSQWCEPAAALHDSCWLAEVTQLDDDGEQQVQATCSRPTPQQLTKYMPLYYRQAAGHRKGDDDTELEDKLQELQQQTLTMHTEWQQQQAAAHTYANRKVKPGTPFARPSLTHPKMVGAAGIVPNNMLKHKRKPVREPDLTRNPSELHVPSQTGNFVLEREGVRRRPPIAKLHCKAFQFPGLVAEQDGKADKTAVPKPVRHHRDYQILGSGFRIRRGHDVQFGSPMTGES